MSKNIQLLRQLCSRKLIALNAFDSFRSLTNKNTVTITQRFSGFNTFFKRCFASQPVPTATQSTASTAQDLFSKTLGELEQKKEEKKPLFGRPKVLVERGRRIRAPDEAWAKATSIKGSIKKVKLVSGLIQGLSYKNAVIQLKLCQKRLAVDMLKLLESARYNAENNHNLDPSRLLVSEILVGRATPLRGIMFRAKGRADFITKRRTHIHIILKELPAKDSRLYSKTQYRKMVALQERMQKREAKLQQEEAAEAKK